MDTAAAAATFVDAIVARNFAGGNHPKRSIKYQSILSYRNKHHYAMRRAPVGTCNLQGVQVLQNKFYIFNYAYQHKPVCLSMHFNSSVSTYKLLLSASNIAQKQFCVYFIHSRTCFTTVPC